MLLFPVVGEVFIVCLYVVLCVCSMSSGGFTRFRLEGPAGSGGVGSVSAVSAQRGNSSITTAGEGRRSRAGVGQGNTPKWVGERLNIHV